MKRVLVDFPLDGSVLQRLRSLSGLQVDEADPFSEEERSYPAEWLRETCVLLCSQPPTNLDQMTSLRWVHLSSAGYEQVLPWRLPERGIRVTNSRGVFDVPIAEWCLAMMVNLARDLRGMMQNQSQHLWDRDARFQREIRGLTVGFWGYGGLAREAARLSKCAGLNVHVMVRKEVTRHDNSYSVPGTGDRDGTLPDRVFSLAEKTEFLRGLDFLVLGLPLNRSTRGLIGDQQLRQLPERAFLLNPARGPLVQEDALVKALRERWIAGAALDTHFHYPLPSEHPLWRMSNVILTPHISGSSRSTHTVPRISDLFFQNAERFFHGRPLLNELTREELTED